MPRRGQLCHLAEYKQCSPAFGSMWWHTKSVRGAWEHVKELYTTTQRRLHVIVEITRWQPCCLHGREACHRFEMAFGNSDLQPLNQKSFAQSWTMTFSYRSVSQRISLAQHILPKTCMKSDLLIMTLDMHHRWYRNGTATTAPCGQPSSHVLPLGLWPCHIWRTFGERF